MTLFVRSPLGNPRSTPPTPRSPRPRCSRRKKSAFSRGRRKKYGSASRVDFREYRKLVAAKGDTKPVELAILFDAGWLGHYVADGSMPLHTSIQYNGWQPFTPNPNHYTTEHHIHSQFESAYVSANIKPADCQLRWSHASKPQVFVDRWLAYLDYLNHTNSLVEKTYQLGKSRRLHRCTGTPEAKGLRRRTALAAGAHRAARHDLFRVGALHRIRWRSFTWVKAVSSEK